jgi:hypothetical protein
MAHVRIAVLVLAGLGLAAPAMAVTASDVLNRMTEKEQYGYITGAVDTIILLEQLEHQGNTARSECISNWFYGKEAPGARSIRAMFTRYPAQSAVGLIKILIDRACGQ